MAKRKKTGYAAEIVQLQSDREWLIRTTMLGLGYVRAALDDATDPVEKKLYMRHVAEIEMAIAGCRPDAEDVLKLLGKKVHDLQAELDAINGNP